MSRISESPGETRRAKDAAPAADRTSRTAALVATAVALPVALLVGTLAFVNLAPDGSTATPEPSPSAPRPQSTAPVEMAAPALAERPATVCRALLSQLPASIRDLPQRPVSAGPEQNAAYGDPALTVACGGSEPEVAPTDHIYLVNAVCWHGVEEADATVLTTLDRETAVTVRVPHFYGEALQWAAPIATTVVASVPSAGPVPSGCTS
ncbi:hypothetical protein GCM10009541_06150 [Micromonospora gifhornensis]|uniref:DUF3515 domain-containing protein n=1 Tax=Micromonospora gifhornensis TaxID=84594 RepID=A0ABQ4ICW3_9ACTN|nr:DUF3515 domain-containing protein [Verrucosispora sp. ts21]GIJ15722.1 hypothetical protein Vgi01_24060 [Micromonospora gifhornensis]